MDQKVLSSGLSLEHLIEEVGQALARWFENSLADSKKVLLLVGPGNNGNDAISLAKHLLPFDFEVSLFEPEKTKSTPTREKLGQGLEHFWTDTPDFNDFDIIVDGLFGIGLNKKPSAPYARAIQQANDSSALRVSLDIASGVCCDNGEIFRPVFVADHTLAIAALKPGHFLLPGTIATGELHSIRIPSLENAVQSQIEVVTPLKDQSPNLSLLTPSKASHKYNRGQVQFVMSETYPGACLLSAKAAQDAGAGYVLIFCPESKLEASQIKYPEFVFRSYKDKNDLHAQLLQSNAQSFVLGPGWDLGPLDISSLLQKEAQFVFDGGLLTPELLQFLKTGDYSNYVLTPHHGELTRLFEVHKTYAKWNLCLKWQKEYSGVIVAKGYDSLIAQKNQQIQLTTWNAPALAVAGSGDILAGLIGAFLAKGLKPFKASLLAVDLHRQAGKKWPVSCSPIKLLETVQGIINRKS